ncbi:GNAT family N-acetyltransferase [Phormidium sp. LEGE 05292]|uniref:GNAT family N-acetyltransferase n=1 Tax=[Phormidium] sp. LEGE 05292 TaxID=767427 RepID=UPI0018829F11|nr:GNAT family N-acetyltransferase [Phormidium sp. LEGE 05292]MBE9223927.1 GNAT family N-acetyltransferase [Phormidium sp. LEGE 05292]
MLNSNQFKIRPMTLADLELSLEWAATEGWNPGIYDAEAFYATDPGGFLMGEINGEPISSISAVRYDDKFGFIGLYIVQPNWRGQGFGLQTWNAGLKLLGDRNIALDGVLAQVENYRKFGFQLAYRHVRYAGLGMTTEINKSLVLLSDVGMEKLLNYDRQYFPTPRPQFLQKWINQPENAAYGFLKNDNLSGYGVLRKCRNGFKIGPLFAEDSEIAESLFLALINHAQNQPIFLDTPDANSQAIYLAQKYSMQPVFECVRMYTRGIPEFDITRVFGVTTLELG